MNFSSKLAPLFAVSMLAAGACQSHDGETRAVLASADAETMAAVRSVLAEAVGRATVELGPGDPTTTPTISVLPPPLSPREDRSTAAPTQFDIVLKGGTCFVVRRDTDDEYELDGVLCRAVDR